MLAHLKTVFLPIHISVGKYNVFQQECFESKKLIINNFVRDFKNEKAFGIVDNSGQILVVDILCHISPKLFPDLLAMGTGWVVGQTSFFFTNQIALSSL